METVRAARFARGIGDVEGCIQLSDSAVRHAQFEHDFETAYLAAEVPGRMRMGRGEYRDAEAHYRYALDLLLMHARPPEARLAGAYHDLALAVRETGDRRQFKVLAAKAFTLYDSSNPRNPCITGLLADLATDDLERHPGDRDHANASLAAWKAVPASMRTPHYRLTAAAHQMRCSAILGLHGVYDVGRGALNRFLAEMPDGESVSLILTYAGGGALAMRDFRGAAEIAECAIRRGTERGESVPVEEARAVLDAATAETEGVRT